VVFLAWVLKPPCPRPPSRCAGAKRATSHNFYFFCQHITLIPTLRSLLEQPDNGIDAFLAPGHVSMVIGTDAYGFIAQTTIVR
jgi:hydrogenase expression/formation protein HypD